MNQDSLTFSIIIPVYNGESTIPDTLNSIRNLASDQYELIVVDDGSTDQSAAIARNAGARVVSMAQNSGPAAARNAGANEAKHDIIVFTDSDVLVPKTMLGKLETRFRESAADCVQGVFSEVCPFGNYFSQYKNLYNRFVLKRLPDWIDTTYTSITAVKKEAFLECGGFDENIRGASVEDRTLGRNLIQAGYRIRLDRSLEVVHNKRLGLTGFFRNQYRRSRDLIKLMLRNRRESATAPETATPLEEDGRFGTNSPQAMIRIPVAYAACLFFALTAVHQGFLSVALAFVVLFLYLIHDFQMELFRANGLSFFIIGMFINFADALVSGAGVAVGLFEYQVFNKRY